MHTYILNDMIEELQDENFDPIQLIAKLKAENKRLIEDHKKELERQRHESWRDHREVRIEHEEKLKKVQAEHQSKIANLERAKNARNKQSSDIEERLNKRIEWLEREEKALLKYKKCWERVSDFEDKSPEEVVWLIKLLDKSLSNKEDLSIYTSEERRPQNVSYKTYQEAKDFFTSSAIVKY